jgi:hypothetical protein
VRVTAPGETRRAGLAGAVEPMWLFIKTAPFPYLDRFHGFTISLSYPASPRQLHHRVKRLKDRDFYYAQYDIIRLPMSTSGIKGALPCHGDEDGDCLSFAYVSKVDSVSRLGKG